MVIADVLENEVVCPTAGVSPQDNHTNGTNKAELQRAAHRENNRWAARLQDTKESGILFIIKKNGRVVREAWTPFSLLHLASWSSVSRYFHRKLSATSSTWLFDSGKARSGYIITKVTRRMANGTTELKMGRVSWFMNMRACFWFNSAIPDNSISFRRKLSMCQTTFYTQNVYH
jgi:hypothetical protein